MKRQPKVNEQPSIRVAVYTADGQPIKAVFLADLILSAAALARTGFPFLAIASNRPRRAVYRTQESPAGVVEFLNGLRPSKGGA